MRCWKSRRLRGWALNAPSMQHTIIALVQDRPGVLTRLASLFRRRGFNIASLAVGASEEPGLSRLTFVVTRRPIYGGAGPRGTWKN